MTISAKRASDDSVAGPVKKSRTDQGTPTNTTTTTTTLASSGEGGTAIASNSHTSEVVQNATGTNDEARKGPARDVINKGFEEMRATFDYPVFTQEFLFFNRKRDEQVKELLKKKTLLEASNSKLKKQVKELDEVVGRISKEVETLSTVNNKFGDEFVTLRRSIIALTGVADVENTLPQPKDAAAVELDSDALTKTISRMDVSLPDIHARLKSIADRLRTTIANTVEDATP